MIPPRFRFVDFGANEKRGGVVSLVVMDVLTPRIQSKMWVFN